MVKLDKTKRDVFIMDFVHFVSSPQTSAKRLRKWNSVVKQCPENMIEEEWMRLWRGVYYIVWYEEMRKGGEEFITHIAEWDNPNFILFGFKSMAEFWGGIDAFRIDKYMFLARKMLIKLFKLLQDDDIKSTFDSQQVLLEHKNKSKKIVHDKINELIEEYSMRAIDYILTVASQSVGFTLHLLDIFVTELQSTVSDVTKQSLFLIPFIKRLSLVEDDRLRTFLNSKVFFPFITSTLGQHNTPQISAFVQELSKIASNIAAITEKGKNRTALYELSEFCKTSLEKIKKAHEGKLPLKLKPTSFNRKRHRFRYEQITSVMYPKSLKPIAFICDP